MLLVSLLNGNVTRGSLFMGTSRTFFSDSKSDRVKNSVLRQSLCIAVLGVESLAWIVLRIYGAHHVLHYNYFPWNEARVSLLFIISICFVRKCTMVGIRQTVHTNVHQSHTQSVSPLVMRQPGHFSSFCLIPFQFTFVDVRFDIVALAFIFRNFVGLLSFSHAKCE